MPHQFGRSSRERLDTCHPDIILILTEALAHSPIDFGVSEGVRSEAKQLEYFLAGKSRLDPRNPDQRDKCRHLPNDDGVSMAVDVYAWVHGKQELSYDFNHLSLIAGVILSTASTLYNAGAVSHRLRWGGNWDSDGEIITDQSFNDLPHFELVQ